MWLTVGCSRLAVSDERSAGRTGEGAELQKTMQMTTLWLVGGGWSAAVGRRRLVGGGW